MHVLTFSKSHADKLSVDAAVYGDCVERGRGSQSVEVNGKVAALRGGNDHGHDEVADAHSTRSSPALACRCRRGGVRRLAGGSRPPEIPNTHDNDTDKNRPV